MIMETEVLMNLGDWAPGVFVRVLAEQGADGRWYADCLTIAIKDGLVTVVQWNRGKDKARL